MPNIVVTLIIAVLSIYLYSRIKFAQQNDGNENNVEMGSGEMFNSIAPYYDLANKFMSLGFDQSWRKEFVHNYVQPKYSEIIVGIPPMTSLSFILLFFKVFLLISQT